MDDFLGRVLATLDQTGQREQTTIVLTADHGDELLEHGHVGHASTAHFATLYEELLRIPLLVIDPRIVGPRRSQARVQLQDLMPTLLSLAGGTCPQPLPDAVDLSPIVLDALAGSAATPERLPAGLGPQRPLRFHSSRMGYQTLRRFDGQAVLGFSQGNTKYICERFDEERRLLFDLATDPQEQHPVTQGPAVDAAHARLRELCPGVPA
jgi:arylsulfatase A-like enzyme